MGSKQLSSCKHNEKGYHLPKARCWLDLAPLSPRTALRTNPLSDLDGSTELAEPPLVGMMRLPRTMRHRLERDARAKRFEVRRNTPSPVARLPCWFLRRGRACRAWVRRSGPTPLPGAHGHDVEDLVVEHTVGASATARGQQNRART